MPKKYVDLLVVTVSDGTHVGQGEGTAIYYRGETAEECARQIAQVTDIIAVHTIPMARALLQSALPPGAARNALDCALWDLEAKQTGQRLWELVGMKSPPVPLETAFTISLGTPDAMHADARDAAANGYSLLKLKLNGDADRDRVAAVRAGAPKARIIVDANESLGDVDIAAEAEILKTLGVAMIEQPLPAGQDAALANLSAPLPIFADESCHVAADVPHLAGLYQGVNIKLDKAGGLTEALALCKAAESAKMGVRSVVCCRPALPFRRRFWWRKGRLGWTSTVLPYCKRIGRAVSALPTDACPRPNQLQGEVRDLVFIATTVD